MATDTADETTEANRRAWNARRFDTWISAFGSVEAEAARIIAEPERLLRRISPYLADLAGKRICNVQGSHGRIAVALALLGADVTVVDFSEENRRFALALAEAAGVAVDYIVCDIMDAGNLGRDHHFDVLLLELGVLHYHQNLGGFLRGIAATRGGPLPAILERISPSSKEAILVRGTTRLLPDRADRG